MDRFKEFEKEWDLFKEKCIHTGASTHQIECEKRDFYSGAFVAFNMMRTLAEQNIPENEAAIKMDKIYREVMLFLGTVAEGTGYTLNEEELK